MSLALLAAGYYFTLPLILKGVMAPGTRPDRQGWSAYYTSPSSPGNPSTQALFPPKGSLTTDRGADMIAYGLWFAPKAGTYALNLYARGNCELSLDDQLFLSLEGDTSGQAKLDLEAGPHLLGISLKPIAPKDGSCRLEIFGQDDATKNLLADGGLRSFDPDRMATWLRLGSLSKNALVMVALAYLVTILFVLLPLSLSGGWLSLGAASLIILLPALALPAPPRRVPFIGGPQVSRLQADKPDFAVIGNSYANCSIDSDLLGKLTGGKVEQLIYTGSETTIHYLMFKNILVASGVRPKTTFIFTSDNSLTNPHLMVFPKAFETLCPEGEDALVNELVFGNRPLKEYLRKTLGNAFMVRAYREDIQELVPNLAQRLTKLSELFFSRQQSEKIRKHVNKRFDLDRLRARANLASAVEPDRWNDDYDYDQYLDFDRVVGTSFLPHIISLAHEHQLRLVFVRIQRRPSLDGPPPQDPRLVRYVERLRAYLQERGVGFHDFTGDPELTVDLYMEDDHIADAERFTKLFCRRLAWALQ